MCVDYALHHIVNVFTLSRCVGETKNVSRLVENRAVFRGADVKPRA